VLGYLGLTSGLIVVAVGVGMAIGLIRRRRGATRPDHPHVHDYTRGHSHPERRSGRWSLAGLGVAGGLVPSPSALIVLLAAIGLGRAAFGVLLVVAYGFGMAVTLTTAGLLLFAVQRSVTRAGGRLSKIVALLPRVTPVITAGLIVVIGLGLTLRSAIGMP
jgi:ABC-type nickel/cobalt efflux system permease component RcnA